ncbi:MHC class I-like protein MILL2 [Acomys russatus]|uniref:MHC class I-like protein MILL2 n=1 Tax=Acomys russatus TaxID=60746 RepID=UPI0021E2B682|nr:MHC class I-like protein MILL2 [Acomys russatus]
MWMKTVLPKDLRVLGVVQLWTVYLLLDGLLGTCAAVKIITEEPPGTMQPAGHKPFVCSLSRQISTQLTAIIRKTDCGHQTAPKRPRTMPAPGGPAESGKPGLAESPRKRAAPDGISSALLPLPTYPAELTVGAHKPVSSGSHTLRYNLMTFSREVSGEPRFLALGYLDDELFLRYDGDKRTAEPWGPGFEGHGGAETWARETETLREKEDHLREMLADVISQQSQNKAPKTPGFLEKCSAGYRGKALKRIRSHWSSVPASHSSLTTGRCVTYREGRLGGKQEQGGPLGDPPCNDRRVLTLINSLYLLSGPPRMSVTLKKSSHGKNKLTCWAFNLYPRVANLAWLQNGKPTQEHTWGPGTTLPSGDGTYQTRVSVWVLPGQEAQFTCNLRHHSHDREIPAVSEENQARTSSSVSAPAASALSVVLVFLSLAYTTQPSKRPVFWEDAICSQENGNSDVSEVSKGTSCGRAW